MDCNMPIMDGYQACQEIKQLIADNELPSIKVSAYTADASLLNLEKCKSCLFDEVLVKPVRQ